MRIRAAINLARERGKEMRYMTTGWQFVMGARSLFSATGSERHFDNRQRA